MIVGITGRNCSGKGEFADYLIRKSFYFSSLSDEVRREIRARGLEETRENLIAVGNDLRARFGPSILAERVYQRLEKDRNHVVDSIRNPSEVEFLKGTGNFLLVEIQADPETRFKRMLSRKREGDPDDLETFLKLEQQEESSPDPSKQQMKTVCEMADHVVENSGSIDDLHILTDRFLAGAVKSAPRPGWDDYFMNIASVVASRSNCVKRHVAAVIVRDKRIISTGYNGTPRGTRNCDEGGCPRCNSFADGGTKLDECLCSHGEENAITQAAYHGVSVKDGTIYSTFSPCLMCSKMIINSGIREVVYNAEYPLNETAGKLLKEAGVIVRKINCETEK